MTTARRPGVVGRSGPATPAFARAWFVSLLSVPSVLAAHASTGGALPGLVPVLLVALVLFTVTALSGARSRHGLAVTVGAGQLLAHVVLYLHLATGPGGALAVAGHQSSGGCLPAVGRGAELGLRLALLRADPACPDGALAATPTLTSAVAALFGAVLILLGHGLVAVLGSLAVTAAETGLRLVGWLLALVPLLLRFASPVPAVPQRLTAAPDCVRLPGSRFRPAPQVRRGPPVALATV